MLSQVYVFGTSHEYQRPDSKVPTSSIHKFEEALKAICATQKIALIAEENNLEAQTERKLGDSLPCKLAQLISLHHLYCDPDRKTRTALGIRQENDIRASHLFDDVTEEDIQAELMESHKIRERYWLAELRKQNLWPALFICGANHVQSLVDEASLAGLAVEVVQEDWPAQ